ncbi:DUF1559 domain-containing protein [Roseiconus nitratireducens]|uniref:DUF1559 domain-containing protein n=1 Tax=Roseiconus nitratireducens TaxID=2605748 RepID=A0A5M6D3X8_9BACT|nr:DUF1559 domain-containing protein [Roseiconus nitratireducens]
MVPEPAAPEVVEEIGIPPIDERQPEEPLSDPERRKRSYDNLLKINEAILTYLQQNGHYPRAYQTTAGNVPTLSWRVELLPYLGYESLYKRFDKTRAWNMPPNKDLLQFIPDEYVSPERFDTKTNYLLPIDSAFIFGENRAIRPSMIDDGAANTIMLVEVNDQFAVNWTEPKDFDPQNPMQMSPYLGGLRSDGTFALWASGFPVLLESGLSDQQLFRAMSYNLSDAMQASDIHRPIAVQEAEADPVIQASLPDQLGDEQDPESALLAGVEVPPGIEEQQIEREPMPSPIALTAAQDKLRGIFLQDLQDADSEEDKAKLAAEFLKKSADMDSDPAGAFALQRAALRLAVDAGDARVLIQAIDQRVARFEVNSFRENLKWIQEYGEATASRDSTSVKADKLLQRSIPVIYAGIRENEFMRASAIARIAHRYTGMSRDEKVPRLLLRLRSQLGAANREYEQSVDDLEAYRVNPDNVAAGAAFGRFLCFIKGDWQTGLPLIAAADGGDLAEVARMDLRGARRASDQVAIGDAWWELSERAAGAYGQGAQDRAVLWYEKALEVLPESLDKIHVRNRLQEADDTDGRSPVALCVQLADELGIDLSQSLTSIAADGDRRMGNRDDDDD